MGVLGNSEVVSFHTPYAAAFGLAAVTSLYAVARRLVDLRRKWRDAAVAPALPVVAARRRPSPSVAATTVGVALGACVHHLGPHRPCDRGGGVGGFVGSAVLDEVWIANISDVLVPGPHGDGDGLRLQ